MESKKKDYTFILDHPGETRLSNDDQPPLVHLPVPSTDQIKLQVDDQGTVLVPAYRKGYSLLYGTELTYIVLKMISTIYERLLKAKQLIEQQTQELLSQSRT